VRGLVLGVRWRQPVVDDPCGGGCGRRERSWPRQVRDGPSGNGHDARWTACAAAQAAAVATSAGRHQRRLQPVWGGDGVCHGD
jgi:hypothetical protein